MQFSLNAALIHTNLGCGTLGFLALVVTHRIYDNISYIAFIPPINTVVLTYHSFSYIDINQTSNIILDEMRG